MSQCDNCFERAIVSADDNYKEWLKARATGVTATEVKSLFLNPARYTPILLQQKTATLIGKTKDILQGNKYIMWGREREPVIASTVQMLYPKLQPERRLFHSAYNKQYLASPDMLGYDNNNRLCCGEIKTSSKNIIYPSQEFNKTGYYYQIQWQLFVLNAEYCVYVLEKHDNQWIKRDGKLPAPTPEPVQTWVIKRNDTIIKQLQNTADIFLNYYNGIINCVK